MIIGFSHNGPNTGISSKLTQWFTMQPYTHCELFIEPNGLALSARTDGQGVSLKPAQEVLSRSSHWEFWYVPTANPTALNEWALAQVGKRYDYADIARMFSPVSLKFAESWFCSELCYVAARDYGTLHIHRVAPDLVHPGALLRLLQKAGATPIDAYSSLLNHEN